MEQQVAIVTGAAGGIGRAIAEKFLSEGYRVVWVDIDAQRLMAKKGKMKVDESSCLFMDGDLQDMDFLQRIVDECMAKWGRIDVLVNNAVWRKTESLTQTSLEDWNRTLAISLTAPAFLSKFVAKALVASKQNCVFINMSSVMAQLAPGYATAYTVCKGAIESLTYELATLYGRYGFRAVALRPGNVKTDLSADFVDPAGENVSGALQAEIEGRTPLGRSASADEIAEAVVWISSPKASFITATTLTIDGGLVHNFNAYASKMRLKPAEF